MNLSKTKYCNGLQCKKMLWLYKNKPEEQEQTSNERILNQGNLVHEVARYLFGEHITIQQNDDLNEMIKDTSYTIESYKDVVIAEASFRYNNCFCSVDILKKNNDNYELYEIKSSTDLKSYYLDDTSFQYYVLTNLNIKVNKCYLVHINSDYIRKDKIDLDKLFTKEDITDEVINLQSKVSLKVKEINDFVSVEDEPFDDLDLKCFKPFKCPFFKYCSKNLPSPNVFDISGMRNDTKIKFYKQGKYKYEDLLNEKIGDSYRKQVEFEINNQDYINKEKIKEFLNTLTMPLYFLDFETFQMPIPLYEGIRPYEQVPFQYSLHYIENGKLEHKEFIAKPGSDPRRELAESLVRDIPKDVCVLAYNMSFEKTTIKKLAITYKDLSSHLMNIYYNVKDLMIPFQEKSYYTKDMHGSYSIKYVLPALFPNDESLNYKNLELIHNGGEAMDNYANMLNMNEEERNYTKERLLRYCELDTYAMVKIYEKLQEVVK